MGAVGRTPAGGQDPVGAGVQIGVVAGVAPTALAGDPLGVGGHTHLVGEGGVVVADHGAHDVGAVALVVARGAPADIGGVVPADGTTGVARTFVGLVQGGVVPLHAGINIGHKDAVALHAELGPEVIGVGVYDAPVEGLGSTFGNGGGGGDGVNKVDPGGTDESDFGEGGQVPCRLKVAGPDVEFVAGDKGLVAQAAVVQEGFRPFLGALGRLCEHPDDELAAFLPAHRVGRGEVGLFGETDDEIGRAASGQPVEQ